jgi:hypothetical protein
MRFVVVLLCFSFKINLKFADNYFVLLKKSNVTVKFSGLFRIGNLKI